MSYRRAVSAAGTGVVVVIAALILSAGAAQAATRYPYTFVNADGSTTIITHKPKRVVVVGVPYSYPGSAIAAGANVVGAQPYQPPDMGLNPQTGFPAWLGNTSSITNIGYFTGTSPNYETIASLNPDLIIAQSTFPTAELATLQAIAPMITLPPSTAEAPPAYQNEITWEYFLQKLAPVFDSTARSNAFIAQANQRAETLRGFVHGQTVTQIVPAGVNNGADFQQSVSSNNEHFLALAGFKITPLIDEPIDTSINGNGPAQEYFSTEYIPDVTADYVILEVNGDTQLQYSEEPAYNLFPASDKVERVQLQWGLFDPFDTLQTVAQFGPLLLHVNMLEAAIYPPKSSAKAKADVTPEIVDLDAQLSSRKLCFTGSEANPHNDQISLEQGKSVIASLGRLSTGTSCKRLAKKIVNGLIKHPAHYDVELLSKKGSLLGTGRVGVEGGTPAGIPKS